MLISKTGTMDDARGIRGIFSDRNDDKQSRVSGDARYLE